MPTKFKVVRNLTLPLFKFVEGTPQNLLITSAMFVGKEMKAIEGKKKEPATLCNVTDMETGEAGQIILHAVVKSILNDEYPNDSYVGKAFEICKKGKDPGKEYNRFTVWEIEAPSVAPAPNVEVLKTGTKGK